MALVLVSVVLVAACSGDAGDEPTIASVDFTPGLTVIVDSDGLRAEAGESADPAITSDPPSVPAGTVIEIRNAGSVDHRVVADDAFDTGVMQPGDTTTVVLASEAELELREVGTGATLTLTVAPRGAS